MMRGKERMTPLRYSGLIKNQKRQIFYYPTRIFRHPDRTSKRENVSLNKNDGLGKTTKGFPDSGLLTLQDVLDGLTRPLNKGKRAKRETKGEGKDREISGMQKRTVAGSRHSFLLSKDTWPRLSKGGGGRVGGSLAREIEEQGVANKSSPFPRKSRKRRIQCSKFIPNAPHLKLTSASFLATGGRQNWNRGSARENASRGKNTSSYRITNIYSDCKSVSSHLPNKN